MPTTKAKPRKKVQAAPTPPAPAVTAAAPATVPTPSAFEALLKSRKPMSAVTPAPNVKQQKVRQSKMAKGMLQMRESLWPGIDESKLWLRTDQTRKGYTTIPRGMPLFMGMIDDASKRVTSGKSVPAGQSYLVLWCRVRDEGMLNIESEAPFAFEAGYAGERNVFTWREHMKVLKELGFIDFKPGAASPCQYVLLLNPYQAAQVLRAKNWVREVAYTTLLQRMSEFGATDLDGGT